MINKLQGFVCGLIITIKRLFNKLDIFFIFFISLLTLIGNIMFSMADNEPISVTTLFVQTAAGFIIFSIFIICRDVLFKFYKPLFAFETGFLHWFKCTFLLGSILGFGLGTFYLCLTALALRMEYDSIPLILDTYAIWFVGGIFLENFFYIMYYIMYQTGKFIHDITRHICPVF